jgi:hypothetical protein
MLERQQTQTQREHHALFDAKKCELQSLSSARHIKFRALSFIIASDGKFR